MKKTREVPLSDDSGKIEYHQGFYAAMQFEYEAAPVEIWKDPQLGDQSVRLDMVIIKQNDDETLSDPIGRFFKKYNVVEYRSPEDSLSIDDFIRTQSCAGLYKIYERNVNEIPLGALTVSLVRHTVPKEMFAALKKDGFSVEENSPGIFYISGPLYFSTQVVVTSRLPEGGYEALKILAKGARKADVIKFIEETGRSDSDYASDILHVSIATNEDLYHKLEEEGVMMGAFERVFHKELTEARETGLNQGLKQGLNQGLSQGLSQGLNRGFSQGRDEGITIGEQRARRSIMDSLIADGMDPEKASGYTGIPV